MPATALNGFLIVDILYVLGFDLESLLAILPVRVLGFQHFFHTCS